MHCSVHPPNHFLQTHLDRLLPDWTVPVMSVLVVLQQCSLAMVERTPDTETQKHQLRQQFMEFGRTIATQLQRSGHLTDIFDPQTGLPTLSTAGPLKLDIVRVVQSCLGYPAMHSGNCKVLMHPLWGSAVYPSVLVSSAHPAILQSLMHSISGSGSSGIPPLSDSLGQFNGIER